MPSRIQQARLFLADYFIYPKVFLFCFVLFEMQNEVPGSSMAQSYRFWYTKYQ